MKHKRLFIGVIYVVLSLYITIASVILLDYLVRNNETFRYNVSRYVAEFKAKEQIALLPSYITLDEAKVAAGVDDGTIFIDGKKFCMYGADQYIVCERDGWKIENTFQFCCGHDGITESHGKHEIIARKVQNQWCICITFFDASIHSYRLDDHTVSLDICNDQDITEHIVLFSFCADDKNHELQIDQSSYVLLDNTWVCQDCQDGRGG